MRSWAYVCLRTLAVGGTSHLRATVYALCASRVVFMDVADLAGLCCPSVIIQICDI